MTVSRIALSPRVPLLVLSLLAAAWSAHADETTLHLTIHEHRFQPEELHAPAGKVLVLEIENRDSAVEEFESYDLDREQRVKPGETGRVNLGVLAKGRYPFFGDYHRKTAQGVLVVD